MATIQRARSAGEICTRRSKQTQPVVRHRDATSGSAVATDRATALARYRELDELDAKRVAKLFKELTFNDRVDRCDVRNVTSTRRLCRLCHDDDGTDQPPNRPKHDEGPTHHRYAPHVNADSDRTWPSWGILWSLMIPTQDSMRCCMVGLDTSARTA